MDFFDYFFDFFRNKSLDDQDRMRQEDRILIMIIRKLKTTNFMS